MKYIFISILALVLVGCSNPRLKEVFINEVPVHTGLDGQLQDGAELKIRIVCSIACPNTLAFTVKDIATITGVNNLSSRGARETNYLVHYIGTKAQIESALAILSEEFPQDVESR